MVVEDTDQQVEGIVQAVGEGTVQAVAEGTVQAVEEDIVPAEEDIVQAVAYNTAVAAVLLAPVVGPGQRNMELQQLALLGSAAVHFENCSFPRLPSSLS